LPLTIADPAIVGESPAWDARTGRLYWVDVLGRWLGVVHGDGAAGWSNFARIAMPTLTAFVTPTVSGGVLLGLGRSLVELSGEGERLAEHELVRCATGTRLNDCAVDPVGRVLCSTIAEQEGARCALVRRELDGSVSVLDDDLAMGNGIGWSPNGQTLYWVDSLAGILYAADYNVSRGLGRRAVHTQFAHGTPDGLSVDSDGTVWVAMWGTGIIERLGEDGRRLGSVDVGHRGVTNLTFAGDDLTLVVATTSIIGATPAERTPGRLVVAPTSTAGLPAVPAPSLCIVG
jgi:sugar lactone lactonase YvrE